MTEEYQIPNGQPLFGKILVKVLPKKEVTKGGIIIADSVQQDPLVEAVVIAVAPDMEQIQQFDQILMRSSAGTEHEFDGIKYKFLQEKETWWVDRK